MFRKFAALILGVCFSVVFCFAATAQPDSSTAGSPEAPFVLGQHYKASQSPGLLVLLEPKSRLREAAYQVSVFEFFSYGCIWCAKLEPVVAKWEKSHEKNKEISFERVPMQSRRSWAALAELYYVAENNFVEDPEFIRSAIFNAIHEDKINLANRQRGIQFLAEKYLELPQFKETVKDLSEANRREAIRKAKQRIQFSFLSPELDRSMQRGELLINRYNITMIPTFIVGGMYETNIQMADGDPEKLIKIIDFLIQKSLEEAKAQANTLTMPDSR